MILSGLKAKLAVVIGSNMLFSLELILKYNHELCNNISGCAYHVYNNNVTCIVVVCRLVQIVMQQCLQVSDKKLLSRRCWGIVGV